MKKFIYLVIVLITLFFASGTYAAGSVNLLISGGYLADSLQSFEYKDREISADAKSGVGILLDFGSTHAFALDYYLFTEVFDETDERYAATHQLAGLLAGYRYHFPSGFYFGGGLMSASLTSTIHDVQGTFVTDDVEVTFERTLLPTFTLGYQHVFTSGLSLGPHLIYTLPEDLKADSISGFGESVDITGELEDFSIQNIAFLIGYAW